MRADKSLVRQIHGEPGGDGTGEIVLCELLVLTRGSRRQTIVESRFGGTRKGRQPRICHGWWQCIGIRISRHIINGRK